jgi:hypothetical protein
MIDRSEYPSRRSFTISFFLLGVVAALAGYLVVSPAPADAGLERPTGVSKPACRKPAGSCMRFFAPTPPTDEEIRDYNARCIDVVWEDPIVGAELYWPHGCATGASAQDIGL